VNRSGFNQLSRQPRLEESQKICDMPCGHHMMNACSIAGKINSLGAAPTSFVVESLAAMLAEELHHGGEAAGAWRGR